MGKDHLNYKKISVNYVIMLAPLPIVPSSFPSFSTLTIFYFLNKKIVAIPP